MDDSARAEVRARLAAHRMVGAAPPEELAWLAAHGEMVRYAQGQLLVRKGQPVEHLYVILRGRFVMTMDRGAGPRKIRDMQEGDVAGLLPYSRLAVSPVDGHTAEEAEMWALPRALMPELIRHCPQLTTTLVHEMLARARTFTAADMQDEKMASLGRLAAGLAHELNNPAAAAARSAQRLDDHLAEVELASRALGAAHLSPEQQAAVERVRGLCAGARLGVESPLQRARREDELAEWLEGRGADAASAADLAETGVTLDALDALAAELPAAELQAAVRWLAAGCTTRALARDLERAVSRIHSLVGSIKRFTHMDRGAAHEPVCLRESLADVMSIVGAKARAKSVTVAVELDEDIPHALGAAGELNQVWLNLLDNALDAAPEAGHVTVSGARAGDSVLVQVRDDGPGIPEELRGRVFDAFFTTKPVGQGTGLGLEIVRRLVVDGHGGEVDFVSRPGSTVFRVKLPAAS